MASDSGLVVKKSRDNCKKDPFLFLIFVLLFSIRMTPFFVGTRNRTNSFSETGTGPWNEFLMILKECGERNVNKSIRKYPIA